MATTTTTETTIGNTTTTSVVTQYPAAPLTGAAIGAGIAGFLFLPYLVIGALGIGVYYAFKK